MTPKSISKITARRFVLGRQGLWPGRRWQGVEGTASALRVIESLQLDPLNITARSQDIALWGRVLDYTPAHLDQVAYQQRGFFDYGGRLSLYPMSELPYWGVAMQRRRQNPRWQQIADNAALLEAIRSDLQARGPLGNRDFAGTARVNSYRGRKDSALALYWMWLAGEVMIHHRRGFDRVYALRSQVAPPDWDWTAAEHAAQAHFARKALAFFGLARERAWANEVAYCLQHPLDKAEGRAWLEALVHQGAAAPVQVEGTKELQYVLAADLELLEILEAGAIPPGWQPLQTTTLEEAVFLAPLDIVSARGRAKPLFDFDYLWEVYKPASQRRWGYYTLPVLYGDRLEARLDPRLERSSGTLWINGFWLEAHAPARDPAFAAALVRGLRRFAAFLGARQVDFLPAGEGPASPDQEYLQRAWQSLNGGG